MSSFLARLLGRRSSPAQFAKDRLKLVLVTDRTSILPEDLEKMQAEILAVIRKYCLVDEEAVNLKFEQRERDNFLVANIPIAGSRNVSSTPSDDLLDSPPMPDTLPEDVILGLAGIADEPPLDDEEATQIIRYRKFDDFDIN